MTDKKDMKQDEKNEAIDKEIKTTPENSVNLKDEPTPDIKTPENQIEQKTKKPR